MNKTISNRPYNTYSKTEIVEIVVGSVLVVTAVALAALVIIQTSSLSVSLVSKAPFLASLITAPSLGIIGAAITAAIVGSTLLTHSTKRISRGKYYLETLAYLRECELNKMKSTFLGCEITELHNRLARTPSENEQEITRLNSQISDCMERLGEMEKQIQQGESLAKRHPKTREEANRLLVEGPGLLQLPLKRAIEQTKSFQTSWEESHELTHRPDMWERCVGSYYLPQISELKEMLNNLSLNQSQREQITNKLNDLNRRYTAHLSAPV